MSNEGNGIDEFFTDDRLVDRPPTLHPSPSGRFRLEVRAYTTREGCWCYSRGTVIRVADGAVVADIRRNHSTFHHSFVIKDGREFLVAGRSYMGQTLVDLERAQEWNDPKHPDGYDGTEFCWTASMPSPDGRTLLVDGCHWACPYEYRFYDLTDPARGWPALPIRGVEGEEGGWLPADDGRPPEVRDDGTIVCFETVRWFLPLQRASDEIGREERATIDDAQWEDPASWETVVDRRVVLVREPDHMRITEDWRRDDRLRRDREQAERDAVESAMHDEWIRRSTTLASLRTALAAHYLGSSLWISTPVGENAGKPGSFTLHVETGRAGVTASVTFGVDEGPLALSLGGPGAARSSLELVRDEAGTREAAAAIKRWLEPGA